MKTIDLKRLRVQIENYSPRLINHRKSICSAVMVLLDNHPQDQWRTNMIFIRRSLNLKRHRGEIAFPGGQCEINDKRIVNTALRELEEELSIHRSEVDIWGQLDDVITNTGFVISPFVGHLKKKVKMIPDPEEVAEVISLPLHEILFFPHRKLITKQIRGIPRTFPEYRVQNHIIWGATARIIDKIRIFVIQRA